MGSNLTTLPNGLEIMAVEDHSLPVVSLQVLVRVGSANENENEAGIAHVVEHMLFKGTSTRPVGAIASEVEAAGGEINAYTSLDHTVYYISMASRFWEKGLDILSDALFNSSFDPAELAKEKEVILEEIRRGRDDPHHLVSEHLFKNAYGQHPYGRPIIGYEETVKSLNSDWLKDFCRRWYMPANMTLVVVGDFTSARLVELASQMFPKITAKPLAGESCLKATRLEKLHVIKRPQMNSLLGIGYVVPEITHPDIAALDVAAQILGGGRASRLEQEVKEKQKLVHAIDAYAITPKSFGIFVIGAQLADKDLSKASAAIAREIERLRLQGPTPAELDRAKLVIKSDEVYEKETVSGLAGKIAYYRATTGSFDFEAEYLKSVMNVSADDVKSAVDKYLKGSLATACILAPERADVPKISFGDQAPAGVYAKSGAKGVVEPAVIKLKGGATLIYKQDKRVPLVGLCAAVRGGIRLEKPGNNGISELLVRSWVKGTKRMSSALLASEVEDMAAHLHAFSGRNSMGISCHFMNQHGPRFLKLLSEILCDPAFAADEVKKEKQYLLSSIKDEEDSFGAVAMMNMLSRLFPKHPYGMRLLGSKASVSKFAPSDVQRHFSKIMSRKGLVVGVIGDIEASEVVELLNENLAGLPETKPCDVKIESGKLSNERRVLVKKKGREQAHIIVGGRATTIDNQDRYPLSVVEQVLAGQGGRLFMELRDKQGLAYAVGMMMHLGVEDGFYALYIGTEPKKVDTALAGLGAELDKLCAGTISDEELNRAKNHIIGTHELSRQKQVPTAGEYALNFLYGVDVKEVDALPDRIRAVTAADVKKVVAKYLDPARTVTSIVTPA